MVTIPHGDSRPSSPGARFLPAVVVLAALVALAGLVSVRADGAPAAGPHVSGRL